jgi:hypothetical protein
MFNYTKHLLGTRSVWRHPSPFACFPIQTNLGTFSYSIILLLCPFRSRRERKTCYVTLGSDILHLSELKKNCGIPRRGENMCPAVRKYKVLLLADTLIFYLVTLFHSARLFYTNDSKDFLRVVNLETKDTTNFTFV